jgi:DNA helicase II / ATP-dependent DNA helicase PcrA
MMNMELLDHLNMAQQQAVMAGLGPVMILAGPGSGKTRVLTQRIAYLIRAMGVRPYQILAVTFTNKAAREMENRLQVMIGSNLQDLTLGTFHATCARILRREAEHLPFNASFVIYDDDDQLRVVKRALDDFNLDEKIYRPQSVQNAISNAKNELIFPDNYPILVYRDEAIKRVYARYQELLVANNAVDFDDLLLYTALLFEENPDVRSRYSRRYEHVLVDEFQDTNMAQYILLNHLASHHNNIFVVGDTDQSIYRWRGADYRNILRFEQDYPGAQTILLEQNYRSTQHILDVAMAVIERNPYRTRKELFTERGHGEKIILHEADNERAEASYVVDTIAALVARKVRQPGDFAVMYRTNAQSRLLEEAFLHAGLPYKLVGAQRFYGRREVKDIIAYLRLVHNPEDEFSLLRVINVPVRGIGHKTLISLRTYAQKVGLSPGKLLLELDHASDINHKESFSARAQTALSTFGGSLMKWRTLAQECSSLQLMDRILEDIDYRSYIDDGSDEGNDRWENVMELRRVAADYQDRSLTDFLADVALVSDQDTLEEGVNIPTLLTLHAAKGLEFPIVFIIGLTDGILPHSRSFEDAEEMQEERRLLYVGITRTKDQLYLIYPQVRNTFGYNEPAIPSRFLDDVPDSLLDEGSTRRLESSLSGYSPTRRSMYWDIPSSAQIIQKQFSPGLTVYHQIFGEGMVLDSRIQDDDEIVDIFFEGVGLKRLAASIAKLEVKGKLE